MANNNDSKEAVNIPPPIVQIDVNPLGVFSSVPQYSELALESDSHVKPSLYSETMFIPEPKVLGPSTPVADPQSDGRSMNSELYDNYENTDNFPVVGQKGPGNSVYREEHDAGPPSSKYPSSAEVLLRMKEQAGTHVRAQKHQNIRDLTLKKIKLQQHLPKLDTAGSEEPLSGSRFSLDEEELSIGKSEEEGRAPPGSEDRQRGGEDESNTKNRDECDHATHRSRQRMHTCWRRIFQAIGLPLSFTYVLVIELLSFILQYVVEMLIVGLVTVLGKQMFTPLFGALYRHAIQPVARLLINVSVAIWNILRPLLAVVRHTILHVALLFQSFRLVEVYHTAPQRLHSRQDV